MGLTLEFTAEQAQQAMREAIEKQLTPELRDKYITETLEFLLKKSYFGDSTNALQVAFREGAQRVARNVFEEEFAKAEVQAKVRELAVEAYERLFNDKDVRDELVERMARALGDALVNRR